MLFFKIQTTPLDEVGLYSPFALLRELRELEQKHYFNKSDTPLTYSGLTLKLYWDFTLKDIMSCWRDWYGILLNEKVKNIIEKYPPNPTVWQLIHFKIEHRQKSYDYYWLPYSNKNPSASINFDLNQNGEHDFVVSEPLKLALEKAEVSGCNLPIVEALSERLPVVFQNMLSRSQPLEAFKVCVLKNIKAQYLTKDRQYLKVVAQHIHGSLMEDEEEIYLKSYPCFIMGEVDWWFNLNHFEEDKNGNWVLELKNEMLLDYDVLSDIKKNALIFCVFLRYNDKITTFSDFIKNYYKSDIRTWLLGKIDSVWYFKIEKILWENLDIYQSRFLGYPSVPDDFEYPRTKKGKPLSFICQLNLTDIKRQFPNLTNIKNGGILSFFVDVYNSEKSWAHEKERFKVFYFPENTPLSMQGFPEGGEIMNDIQPLNMVFNESLDWDRSKFEEFNPRSKNEVYHHLCFIEKLCEKMWSEENSSHKLLGFPNSIQNDVRFEAEFLARNLKWFYGDAKSEAKNRAIARKIKPHIDDWQLLLQINDAGAIGLGDFWGDAGIFFLIRKADLENNIFDNVQVIFQNT